jgi:hypothetical protein
VKRRVRTIAVYLVLGAMLNVAVAWAFALLPTGSGRAEYCMNPQASMPSEVLLIHHVGYSSLRDPIRVFLMLAPYEPEATRFRGPVWWDNTALVATHEPFAIATGWPLRTLSAWRVPVFASTNFTRGVVVTRSASGIPVVIPLHPIARNFAINTVFYAISIWLVVGCMISMRATARLRRGLCPRCAYPRENHIVCPECGTTHKRGISEPIAHALPPA